MRLWFLCALLINLVILPSPSWAQDEDNPEDLPGYSGEIEDEETPEGSDPDKQVDPEPPEGAKEEGKDEVIEDPEALKTIMLEVLYVYLDMQKYLAQDSTWRVKRSAGLIALKVKNFDVRKIPKDFSPLYRSLPKQLRKAARKMYKQKDIEALRFHFRDLSRPMATWANLSKPIGIDVLYCPVYNGSWLQQKGPTRNPYYGSRMLTSGKVVHAGPELPPAAPEGEEDDEEKKKASPEDLEEMMDD